MRKYFYLLPKRYIFLDQSFFVFYYHYRGKTSYFAERRITMNTELQKLFSTTAEDTPVVWVVFGTHTGNSQMLAQDAAEKLHEAGFRTLVCDMEDLETEKIITAINFLLIIVSTDGDGDVPLMAEDFFEFLKEKNTKELTHLSYGVLALGDTTYDYFCKAGKDFDDILERSGAERLVERVDCDVDYEDGFAMWIDNILAVLKEKIKLP